MEDAAVRLYHRKMREHVDEFIEVFGTGKNFEGNNYENIWDWACKRWPTTFPHREYQIRVKEQTHENENN